MINTVIQGVKTKNKWHFTTNDILSLTLQFCIIKQHCSDDYNMMYNDTPDFAQSNLPIYCICVLSRLQFIWIKSLFEIVH